MWPARCRQNPECVITSYSIHYTKLYDIAAGVNPDSIWIETLDYPCELLSEIIGELDLKICLDLGHLMRHGFDIKSAFNKYGSKTAMIHLHGFMNNRDHLDRITSYNVCYTKLLRIRALKMRPCSSKNTPPVWKLSSKSSPSKAAKIRRHGK